jgi:hypothetical protein
MQCHNTEAINVNTFCDENVEVSLICSFWTAYIKTVALEMNDYRHRRTSFVVKQGNV